MANAAEVLIPAPPMMATGKSAPPARRSALSVTPPARHAGESAGSLRECKNELFKARVKSGSVYSGWSITMLTDLKSTNGVREGEPNLLETTIEEKRRRKDLKDKRDLLFERYLKQPMNTRMALEIKLIDDQLAEEAKPSAGKPRKTFDNRLK